MLELIQMIAGELMVEFSAILQANCESFGSLKSSVYTHQENHSGYKRVRPLPQSLY